MKQTRTAKRERKRALTTAQIRDLKSKTGLPAKKLRNLLATQPVSREQKRKSLEKKARQVKRGRS